MICATIINGIYVGSNTLILRLKRGSGGAWQVTAPAAELAIHASVILRQTLPFAILKLRATPPNDDDFYQTTKFVFWFRAYKRQHSILSHGFLYVNFAFVTLADSKWVHGAQCSPWPAGWQRSIGRCNLTYKKPCMGCKFIATIRQCKTDASLRKIVQFIWRCMMPSQFPAHTTVSYISHFHSLYTFVLHLNFSKT